MSELELHPGTRVALARTQMNETDVAKMIAAGELTSPQRFGNSWYFDLRLTGTGRAYRAGLDEYVWRDPSIYLNQEFLDRCNGLPVILDHPRGEMLDSREYLERNIGSVVVPYIKGDEVWGVARILDEPAARYMAEHQVSTSPAVVFANPKTDNETIRMPGGRHLLIEGNPALLDHVAICDEGVWDKSGPPTGVDSNLAEEGRMAEEKTKEEMEREDKARRDAEEAEAEKKREEESRKDAARLDEKLDKLLEGIKVVSDRVDRIEKGRRDEDSETEARQAAELRELAEEEEKEAIEEAKKEAEVAEDSARRARDDRARRDARDRLDRAMRKLDSMKDRMRPDARKMADAARGRMDAAHRSLADAGKRRDDDEGGEMPWAECDRRDGEGDEEFSARMHELAEKHDAREFRKRDDESIAAHCDRVARGARRDAARRADRTRMDSIDRIVEGFATLSARVDRMQQLHADRTPDDENAFAAAQARADSVYQAHGTSAPRPLSGQNLMGYRIMAARGMQKHSEAWKDTDLALLARTDASAFANVEGAIYADAQRAADAPLAAGEVKLWPVQRRLESGHTETRFKGHPLAWMGTFMQPGRTTTRLSYQRDR